MKRIAILACLRANDVCAGCGCLSALQDRTRHFARYAGQEVRLTAFMRCSCCVREDGEPMETHFDAMLSDGILILTDTAEEEQIMQYSFSLLEDGTALYRVSVEDFNVDMYYAKAE